MRPELCVDRSELDSSKAVQIFEQAGCLKIGNIFAADTVGALSDALAQSLEQASHTSKPLQVGTLRQMQPISISGPFRDSRIYAPPELTAFFSKTLGDKFLMSCYSCVTAQPGAPEQHIHQDFTGLFDQPIDSFSPSFAINLFIPLVPLDQEIGTTRVWPKSHRKPVDKTALASSEHIDPELELGSALLVDYRLTHGGTANNSGKDRPILCLAYSRDWFLDMRHFSQTSPLQIDDADFELLDPWHQHLFSRARLYRSFQNS